MRTAFQSILLGTVLLATAGLGWSCNKDDDPDSKDLRVYMMMPYGAYVNPTLTLTLTAEPALVGTINKFPVKATRGPAADATIVFGVDNSQIEAYNAANGTNYQAPPANSYTFNNGGRLTLKAGEMISADSLLITFSDLSVLKDSRGYLFPVTVTAIESKDKGLERSTNYGTIYFPMNVIKLTASTMDGSVITNKTDWKINSTINNGSTLSDRAQMIDGIYTNGSYYITSIDANSYFILDLGAVKTIKGIKMYTYNTSATVSYTPTQYEIAATDASEEVFMGAKMPWKLVGRFKNEIRGSYVTPIPNGEVPYYLEFDIPVTTRFLKMRHTAVSFTNSTYWGTREIEIVE